MIRIIIVDDHKLIRMMFSMALQKGFPDIAVSGEVESGEALFKLLASTPADLVLLDVNLPGMGGVETARRLCRDYPKMKILAFSVEENSEKIKSMLEAGIHGFISKQNCDPAELADAIRTIMDGLEYFGRDIASLMFGVYVTKKRTTGITPEFSGREREVIDLCCEGLYCKEIAERMNISPSTVNTYKERIFRKLGINNTVELLTYAQKNGILRI